MKLKEQEGRDAVQLTSYCKIRVNEFGCGCRNNFWCASSVNNFCVIDVQRFSFLLVKLKEQKIFQNS